LSCFSPSATWEVWFSNVLHDTMRSLCYQVQSGNSTSPAKFCSLCLLIS
jgi:hypothetical protein